ncbi:MAG: FkbM family methyltransferase [Armatimonadetes bacterium]|nr:FkbM family methyltransferase [Armatimonadota bacterium]
MICKMVDGVRRILRLEKSPLPKQSYSQTGEDVIVRHLFNAIGIKTPTYIDIGAHDPYCMSNTAALYAQGSTGVNIEPDPTLFEAFLRVRRRDVNLNLAISDKEGEADFYIMSGRAMNTMSSVEAERLANENLFSIQEVRKIKTNTIGNIIDTYCKGCFPDFMSLDVEGLDMTILQSIDYENASPTVICVETITYSRTGNGVKETDILDFLATKGYIVFADTYHNTIFVKANVWRT